MLHIEEQVQNRINSLLKPLDEQTLRNRHERFSVSLRREDRNLRAAKRRLAYQPPADDNEMPPSALSAIVSCLKDGEVPAPDQFDLLFSLLSSPSSRDERLIAVRTLRQVVALDLQMRVDTLLRLSAAEVVVDLYRREKDETISKELFWAICNLCASPIARNLVSFGAIDIFWPGLWSPDSAIQELALWGLGNICGDADEFRDQLITLGLHVRVVEIMEKCEAESSVERVCVWTLSSLVGGSTPVAMSICADLLPFFCAVLDNRDYFLVKTGLWGLYKVCWEDEPRIQAILNTGHAPQVLALLQHQKRSVSWAALKLVGRILLGSVHQVQALLNLGLLNYFHAILKVARACAVKEVLWCLSNICTQTVPQVLHVLSHPIFLDILPRLSDRQEMIRLEASWVLTNAAVLGKYQAGLKMVGAKVCLHMTKALDDINPRVVFNMLELCEQLLLCGERESELSNRMGNSLALVYQTSYGTVDALERVAMSKNAENSAKATAILQQFFSPDDGDFHSLDSL